MKETEINAFADKAVLERLFTNGPGELLAVNSKAGYLKGRMYICSVPPTLA